MEKQAREKIGISIEVNGRNGQVESYVTRRIYSSAAIIPFYWFLQVFFPIYCGEQRKGDFHV